MLYLDANAHVPMSKAVLKVYADVQGLGHPSAPSHIGQLAATEIETARSKIANLLGAEKSSQIVFTSTCTQACEWGLGLLKPGEVWHSGLEHAAVRNWIDKREEHSCKFKVSQDGVINYFKLKDDCLHKNIICLHVQNEIGTIQPIELFKDEFLFSDMCQSPGKISINLKDMPVDIAAFGAHKFGGPSGVGFLYIKDYSIYKEFGTGSRYYNDRPGTPDTAGIVATAAALEETLYKMPERLYKMSVFQKALEDRLEDFNLQIIGKGAPRVPNTTFVKIPKVAFHILAALSNKQIYVGMGSACGAMHTGVSLTMKALGIEGDAHEFLRISQHGDYGKREALILVDELSKLLKEYNVGK